MPQIGFYFGAAGVGLFGLPIGLSNFYLAWDPYDGGVNGGLGNIYSYFNAASILGGAKIRNFAPIKTPKLPISKGYFSLANRIMKFQISNGGGSAGVATSDLVDLIFEIYDDDSKLLYSASPEPNKPLKVKVKGISLVTSLGIQCRLKSEACSDTNNSIFESLMTTDGPLYP